MTGMRLPDLDSIIMTESAGPAVFWSPMMVTLGVHLGIRSTLLWTSTKIVLLVHGKGEF